MLIKVRRMISKWSWHVQGQSAHVHTTDIREAHFARFALWLITFEEIVSFHFPFSTAPGVKEKHIYNSVTQNFMTILWGPQQECVKSVRVFWNFYFIWSRGKGIPIQKQEVHGPWCFAWHLQLAWQMAIFWRLVHSNIWPSSFTTYKASKSEWPWIWPFKVT